MAREGAGTSAEGLDYAAPQPASVPPMNLHEYQSKQLFAGYGIPVPTGFVASTPEEAADAARRLGGGALGGQGAGARGWPRQGGRRQARQDARRRSTAAAGMLGQRLDDQADGPRGPADPPGLRRVGLEDRARAVPERAAQSRHRPHRVHRLGRRRHGHRGSRREDPREDHPRRDSSGQRACTARTAARSRSVSASRARRSPSSRPSPARSTSSTSSATRAWSRSTR